MNRSYFLLVAMACFAPFASDAQAAFIFGGHEYFLTTTREDWTVAEAEAISNGGHLAAITSAAEQSFIQSSFLVGNFGGIPFWIGLNDAANEGTFVWSTGEAVTYTNWNSGEPNNSGNEDYVAMNWHYALNGGAPQGTWNDTPVSGANFGGGTTGPYFGIIERVDTSVPEPASLAIWGGIGLVGLVAARRRKQRA